MNVTVVPISGDSQEWQCSLLRFGSAKVLLNCGWTESLDPALLEPLLPHLEDLDLILLTHPDVKHLGALPYVLSKHSVKCPVVCTEPVCRLGELSCIAAIEEREKYMAPLEDFDVDDVLRVFASRIKPLSWRQTFHRHAKGRAFAVCPYPAGGHLGGAYWTILSGSFSAVYFVDFEMRRGRYLDGFDISPLLPSSNAASQRWDVVITSTPAPVASQLPVRGADQAPHENSTTSRALSIARTAKEFRFLEETISALRKGGSVIVPADTMGRTQETLLLLEAAWAQDRQLANNYPVVWLSTMGDVVLDQVKTRLEYMSREVHALFETRLGQHPFLLRNISVFQTLGELITAHPLTRPKVILASSPYLEAGDSRELFIRLAGEPRNLFWLLGIPPAGTLARQLLDDFVLRHATCSEYRVTQHVRQPLSDEQLRAYCEEKLQSDHSWASNLPGMSAATADPAPGADQAPQGEGLSAEDGAAAQAETRALLAKSRHMQGTNVLWTPLGWPTSRTYGSIDSKPDGDEYGHRLMTTELNAWKAQDQEGNRYSTTAGGGETACSAFSNTPLAATSRLTGIAAVAAAVAAGASPATGSGSMAAVKGEPAPSKEEKKEDADEVKGEEKVKAEAEEDGHIDAAEAAAAPLVEAATMKAWREALRVHSREPMRYDAREKSLLVCCRVLFLPGGSHDPSDLPTLVNVISPRHVVLLPGDRGSSCSPKGEKPAALPDLVKQLRCNAGLAGHHGQHANADGTTVPEVHLLQGGGPQLDIVFHRPKRKLQITEDVWQGVKFAKMADGAMIARLRGRIVESTIDTRVLALGSLDPDTANGGAAAEPDGGQRLPKEGALFVGLGHGPLTLSNMKEQLLAETSMGEIDFQAPAMSTATPWTSRVLKAGGSTALGWVTTTRRRGSRQRQAQAESTTNGVDSGHVANGTHAVAAAAGRAANGTGAAAHVANGSDAAARRGLRNGADAGAARALRLEGVPGAHFFKARAALYKACAQV